MVLSRNTNKRLALKEIGNLFQLPGKATGDDDTAAMMTNSKTKQSKAVAVRHVRFSRTIHVRAYGLGIGDMLLCEATPHCPRICRHNPLPVVLTDEVLGEYKLPLELWGNRPLNPQTMESQVQRLVACGHQRNMILRQTNKHWHNQNAIYTEATLQRAFTKNTAFFWKIIDQDDAKAEEDTTRVNDDGTTAPTHLDVVLAVLQLQQQMHAEGNIGDVHELAKFYKKLQKKHCSTRPFHKKAKALHFELTGEKDASSSKARSVLADILNFTTPKGSTLLK